jgi:hypothetical protein
MCHARKGRMSYETEEYSSGAEDIHKCVVAFRSFTTSNSNALLILSKYHIILSEIHIYITPRELKKKLQVKRYTQFIFLSYVATPGHLHMLCSFKLSNKCER